VTTALQIVALIILAPVALAIAIPVVLALGALVVQCVAWVLDRVFPS
jgi:hypothetical protein